MKNLKRLGVSVTLMSVLAVVAFAGDTSSPPCAPPDPGITNTPPCASAQITTDDSAAPGTVNSPPASEIEVSITEVAVGLLANALSLF